MDAPSTSCSASQVAYDVRTLTYLAHVDDNLCCPICQSPLVEPKTTTCRHTFCADCIADAFLVSLNCPVDRTPLSPGDVSAAPVVITNLVNDLIVLCPNSAAGCTSTQPRALVEGHLKNECEFVKVACSGCGGEILKKDARSECLHMETECKHCSAIVRKLDMEVHESQCPKLNSVCPYCNEEFSRSVIGEHESVCEEALVQCNSCTVGCPWTGRRKDSSDHASTCAFTYLRPLLQEHARRITTLESENRGLSRKLNTILARTNSERPDVNTATTIDDQTLQILTDQEHLRTDVERLAATIAEMDFKQNMLTMHINENLRTKEEVAMIGAALNNIRTQVHGLQLMMMRRHSLDQPGAASRSAAAPPGASRVPVESPRPNLLEGRRLSDLGDRVKL